MLQVLTCRYLIIYLTDIKAHNIAHINRFIRLMAPALHITLEQWRALMAIVDFGTYAKAAEALHKSQSSVTYAVQKLESVLGIKAFELQGRKAVLTATGQLPYRRAQTTTAARRRRAIRGAVPDIRRPRLCRARNAAPGPDHSRSCCKRVPVARNGKRRSWVR